MARKSIDELEKAGFKPLSEDEMRNIRGGVPVEGDLADYGRQLLSKMYSSSETDVSVIHARDAAIVDTFGYYAASMGYSFDEAKSVAQEVFRGKLFPDSAVLVAGYGKGLCSVIDRENALRMNEARSEKKNRIVGMKF